MRRLRRFRQSALLREQARALDWTWLNALARRMLWHAIAQTIARLSSIAILVMALASAQMCDVYSGAQRTAQAAAFSRTGSAGPGL